MKTDFVKISSWVKSLENSKPYRIMIKNGIGFYEVVFLYDDYHFSDRLALNDLNNELSCQKKILNMCAIFERNIKPRKF
jgi:hypothetical protein